MATERIKRLKDLVARLERLPASEDRDRILRQVRSRAVDVDTGETPTAVVPPREPISQRVVTRPAPKRVPRPLRPVAVAVAVAVAEPALAGGHAKDHDEWFAMDQLLSLEEAPPPPGDQSVPPWTLGLRG